MIILFHVFLLYNKKLQNKSRNGSVPETLQRRAGVEWAALAPMFF
jgi:hypothetical protein